MNVIILTTGISGSSVITGFLTKSGLWTGDKTVYKDNITGKYETYENAKLVDLNDSLIKEAGMEFSGKGRYKSDARHKFSDLFTEIDTNKYKDFIKECDAHAPWIWKDPRLFVTFGFWKNIIDFENTKVVVLHRNSYELWKSQVNKRIIYSYSYLKESENETRSELVDYLESNSVPYISLEYDKFTRDPSRSINKLNTFIGTNLNKEDWDDIYQPTSKFSQYKRTIIAYLIYLKNFKTRIK